MVPIPYRLQCLICFACTRFFTDRGAFVRWQANSRRSGTLFGFAKSSCVVLATSPIGAKRKCMSGSLGWSKGGRDTSAGGNRDEAVRSASARSRRRRDADANACHSDVYGRNRDISSTGSLFVSRRELVNAPAVSNSGRVFTNPHSAAALRSMLSVAVSS